MVSRALRFAERRSAAFDPGQGVAVHGDPHPGNALRAPLPRSGAESGFVFIDPDGFLAAASPSALARGYCRLLAVTSGLDETAIWEWGYLEGVSTGLYCLDFGLSDLGIRLLTTAELIADG